MRIAPHLGSDPKRFFEGPTFRVFPYAYIRVSLYEVNMPSLAPIYAGGDGRMGEAYGAIDKPLRRLDPGRPFFALFFSVP